MADRLLHYVLATAGHVDHGKSSLVKALTGVDPDRLPEEKARGITIDLGFAALELAAPEPCGDRFQLGIVDVPGHEDFVKNMVSGVSAIDLALLVVAADDGWMPQTEEHLQILEFVGVTRAVVALTKADLEPDQASVIAAVRRQLAGTAFADAPIIPTSTISGQGIPELKQALVQLLLRTPPPPDYGKPRLAVDRAFTLRGIGTIVTGTLSGGRLQRGQSVVLQPSGHATRIRSIQSHNQEREWAEPGMRAALNLADVVVGNKARAAGDNAVMRGHWVMLTEYGKPARTIDILVERSTRSLPGAHSSERMILKDSAIVRVHHGTQNAFASLLAGVKHLTSGENCFAQLRLEEPLVSFLGDHLVIRDSTEQTTLAGGIVLDPNAARRAFRGAAQQALLQRRAAYRGSIRVAIETQLAKEKLAPRSSLLLASNFSQADVTRALVELSQSAGLFLGENFVAETGWWEELLAKAGILIHEHHKGHPEHAGLSLSQLRSALSEVLPIAEGFDLLVTELRHAGFVQTSSEIHHHNHRPALPPQLQAAGVNLRAALGAKPLDPPSRKDLTLSSSAQQALRFLIQSGEVVELGPEVVLLRGSYSAAAELIRQHLHRHGSATVSDLRQVVGASRRIVVPLLERLDKEGVTRRQGDARSLR